MKTLDEVINAYELCHASVLSCEGCPYDNGERWRDSDCYVTDVLHYLKEYRILQTAYIRAMADLEDNPPLTWDELHTMEGKPVWVKLLKGKWKGWDVIGGFDEDDFGEAMVTVRGDDYYKLDLGKAWQAFRKERYER